MDDGRAPCLINTSAAKLLGLPNAGEVDPVHVAGGMRRLADRSKIRANTYRCGRDCGHTRDLKPSLLAAK